MKKFLFVLISALCLCLCACQSVIEDFPIVSGSEDAEPMAPVESETYSAGELYGSYLTMYTGVTPVEYLGLPYVKKFESYQDVSDYYEMILKDHFCGARFTIAMASFTDEFLSENDVIALVINEPSSYVNHTADPITFSGGEAVINVTRHITENAPLTDTQYHLLFTAPKGSFDGIDEKTLRVEISEVIDPENNSAFDAERFRLYYPEYWNFCYRADALTDSPELILDVIDGYEELVYFYENYKSEYDLDSNFREFIGTLYNLQACERYVLVATLIPCSDEREPSTSELFVNNLEIFMSLDADVSEEDPKACYLLLTAVERSDLQGVDLDVVNLSAE